jgi:hypothetical protein
MKINTTKRPTEPILRNATVVVMNAGFGESSDHQGLLAISPDGAFYFEGCDPFCRAMSIDELETFCLNFNNKERTPHEQSILDIIVSTIASYRNEGLPA